MIFVKVWIILFGLDYILLVLFIVMYKNGLLFFDLQFYCIFCWIKNEGRIEVFVGIGLEGNRDGLVRCVEFYQLVGLCVEFDYVVYVCDV